MPHETQNTGKRSTLERALVSFNAGDIGDAEHALRTFIENKFSLRVAALTIRKDSLSLNSINGTFDTADGRKLFFKFHMEENEETVKEYYRAELLATAGYPVETPCFLSRDPGEQVLIYPYKDSERLADMCRRLEKAGRRPSEEYKELISAQETLDRICAEKCLQTLKDANPWQLKEEPLLQLFYWRLVDVRPDGSVTPGGRHHRFYVDQDFLFPDGLRLPYDELKDLRWSINGLDYPVTLERCFETAREVLNPDYYPRYAACTAHGDAHNGNVWANKDAGGKLALSWFDPAFAGEYIPVLLAEVKPLFHNIFAHPDWLYDAREADRVLDVSCDVREGKIHVRHNWTLPDLRRTFLFSKLDNFWKPVLKVLQAREQLPENWENYVRAALFCCPALVMNLRADAGSAQNSHTPKTSLLGLSIAIMLGSPPADGNDDISTFFNELRKAIQG